MAIEIRGMAPLLQVFDMPTSIGFYRDVLGFEVESTSKPRGERFDWAAQGQWRGVDAKHGLRNHARSSVPDPARIAAHDDTAIYFGRPDVDAAYAHLRARGVAVKEPQVAHCGMKQLYVSDPDGYNLWLGSALRVRVLLRSEDEDKVPSS